MGLWYTKQIAHHIAGTDQYRCEWTSQEVETELKQERFMTACQLTEYVSVRSSQRLRAEAHNFDGRPGKQ